VQDSEALELARRGARATRAHNAASHLPVERTSFVGREGDIANIVQILGRSRLLTLTGSAASGKRVPPSSPLGGLEAILGRDLVRESCAAYEGAAIAAKIAMTIQPLLTDQADTSRGSHPRSRTADVADLRQL